MIAIYTSSVSLDRGGVVVEEPLGLVVPVTGRRTTDKSVPAAFEDDRMYKNAPKPSMMSTKSTQPVVTPTMNPTEETCD